MNYVESGFGASVGFASSHATLAEILRFAGHSTRSQVTEATKAPRLFCQHVTMFADKASSNFDSKEQTARVSRVQFLRKVLYT